MRQQIEQGTTAVNDSGVPTDEGYLRKTDFVYDAAENLTDRRVFAWDPNSGSTGDWSAKASYHARNIYDNRNLLVTTIIVDVDDPGYPATEDIFRKTDFVYDANSRQISSTTLVGEADTPHIDFIEYDSVGNVVLTRSSVDDVDVSLGEFTYNARNELVTSTNALGHTQTYTYDANGNQITATDAEGFTSRVFYDALNRQVAVQDQLGSTTTFEYDVLGNLTATITPLGEHTTSEYNENNELCKQISPLINHGTFVEDGITPVELAYDKFGRLIRTFDARPDGATGFMQNETDYNAFGEIKSVKQMVTPLDGSMTQDTLTSIFGYDGLGRELLAKDPAGNITKTEYDVLGRIIKLTQAAGTSIQVISEYGYDPAGNRVTEVRASNGDPNTTTDEETNTAFLYDELNRLIKTTVIDLDTPANNLDTEVLYDEVNHTVTTTDPYDVTTTVVSDAAGRRISLATGGVVSSTWEYDRRGLVVRSDTPDDAPTVFEYDARGQLVRQIEAPGSAVEAITRFEYDANGRQTRVTDPLGYITQSDYDVAGRVIRTVEALGTINEAITKYNYDANGNLLSVIDANHIHDQSRATITDAEFQEEAVRYVYDELNRRTHTYDFGDKTDISPTLQEPLTGDRPVETILYDDNGNAMATRKRDGQIIHRTFDALNRVTLVKRIKYLGQTVDTPLQEFDYDKQSRIKTASDYNADLASPVIYSTDYKYDFAGRVEEEAAYPTDNRASAPRAHAVKTSYAESGIAGFSRVVTKDYIADATPTTPTVTRTFTYIDNLRGLLAKVESTGVTDTEYTYNGTGRLVSQTLGSSTLGHTLTLTYDPRGRESERRYLRNADTTKDSFRQVTTYDAAGNVKTESVTDYISGADPVTDHYGYDPLHRLTRKGPSVTPNASNDTEWDHDAVGNWTGSDQNGTAEVFTPNDDNEYTDVGPTGSQTTYTYDARGNLTQNGPADGDHIFTYDWNNRLIRVEERVAGAWATKADYYYDALNRRVAKRLGPNSTDPLEFFVHDGSRVVMELYDPEGYGLPATTITARSFAYNAYIDAPLLLADEEGAVLGNPTPWPKKAYYLQDRRFGVTALVDESGTVVERNRYEAYGRMTVYEPSGSGWVSRASQANPNQSAYNNPYGFTGRRYDPETATSTSPGLWYYRNRMYSSTLGRFLQRDPAGYIDGYNLYAYVRNNPLAFVDAMGLGLKPLQISSQATLGAINDVLSSADQSFYQLEFDLNQALYERDQRKYQMGIHLEAIRYGAASSGISDSDYMFLESIPGGINAYNTAAFEGRYGIGYTHPEQTRGQLFRAEYLAGARRNAQAVNNFVDKTTAYLERQAINSGYSGLAQDVAFYGHLARGGTNIGSAVFLDTFGTAGAAYQGTVQIGRDGVTAYSNARNTGYGVSGSLYQGIGVSVSTGIGVRTGYEAYTDQDTLTLQEFNRDGYERWGAGFMGTSQLFGSAAGVMAGSQQVRNLGVRSANPTTAINPRLTQRLEAWRNYQAGGGQMDMGRWVKATQGNSAYGTGFKSGYGSWIRSLESVHGNSALSTRTAYLYRLQDTQGNLLKWGVTQDMGNRYPAYFMADKRMVLINQGRRGDMLRLERGLVETQPGPLNNEAWAGLQTGGQ